MMPPSSLTSFSTEPNMYLMMAGMWLMPLENCSSSLCLSRPLKVMGKLVMGNMATKVQNVERVSGAALVDTVDKERRLCMSFTEIRHFQ